VLDVTLTDNFQYQSQFVDNENISCWDKKKWPNYGQIGLGLWCLTPLSTCGERFVTIYLFLYIIYFVECPCLSLSCCEFESHSGKVYSIQHYVIKFVSDLWQVWGFLQFPLPIKHNWNIVESGLKHHNPNPILSIIWSFSLISTSDIFIINELTLILKIIGQCDVKHTWVGFEFTAWEWYAWTFDKINYIKEQIYGYKSLPTKKYRKQYQRK
jgi:hypothetical protein